MAKPASSRPRARQGKVPRASGGAKKAARAPHAAGVAPATAQPGKPARPPTAFERRLYDVCKCIPAGRVATYGVLAQVLGSAPRACGQVGTAAVMWLWLRRVRKGDAKELGVGAALLLMPAPAPQRRGSAVADACCWAPSPGPMAPCSPPTPPWRPPCCRP